MEFLGLTLFEWVLPIAIGVSAGLLTNAIAIWMLFHPHQPIYVGPVRLLPMGAVPKEIDRIARRIGETVGRELLTPNDIARTLSSESFRSRFDETLRGAMHNLLDREFGSLREMVAPEQVGELRGLLDRLAEKLIEVIEAYLQSPDWEARVRGFARELTGELRERPFGGVLTPELRADLSGGIHALWESVRESTELSRVIGEATDRGLQNLLVSEKPLRHYVPTGAVNLGETFVAQYLPLLLERLGEVLDEPETRATLQTTLRRFVNRFLEEQQTWKRIVGRMVITERTLAQTVDAIEQGGAEEIAAMLREEDVQERVARAINDGIEDLLDRPVRDLLGSVTPERAQRVRQVVVERVLYLLRHPTTEEVILRRVDAAFEATAEKSFGDVLQLLGEERARELTDGVAEWVVGTLRGPRVVGFLRGALERQTGWLLGVRLGRMRDLLPPDAVRRAELILFDPLWDFLQQRVPAAVAGLPVAVMVENKLKGYPIEKVEEIVWRVSRKELVLIIYLGGFLGALIGSLMLLTASIPAGVLAAGVFMTLSFVFINLKG